MTSAIANSVGLAGLPFDLAGAFAWPSKVDTRSKEGQNSAKPMPH